MSTSTPPPGPSPAQPQPPGPTGTDSFFDALRRTGLVRSEERWVGGVAGGLALRLGVDPLVVRGLLAVSVLFGGLGLVLYGLAWALLPEQRDGRIHLQQLARGDVDAAVLGAIVVFAMGLAFPDRWNPGMWWGADRGAGWAAVLWISAIAVVVVLVVSASRGGHGRGPTTALPPHAPAPGWGPAGDHPTTPGTPPGAAPTSATRGPAMTSTPVTPAADRPTTDGPTAYAPAGRVPYATGPTGPTTALPTGGGPGWPGTPAPPAALPRRRPSGPGTAVTGVVVALTLLTLAVLMLLEREGSFGGPVLLTTGAVGIVLAGAAIVLSGLRGRTSGSLGFFAVVAILVVGPSLAVVQHDWTWYGSSTGVGQLSHTPRTAAEAEEGYSIGAGEARIDLTEVPTSGEPVEVPVSVGAGEVTLIVPEGGDYSADVQIFAGEVTWLGESLTRAGAGRATTYASESVEDGAEPDLLIDVTVGAGSVVVRED